MSTLNFSSTVVSFDGDVLERMEMAVEKVQERLRRATSALEAASLRYAVIGGNAVAAWVSRVDPAAARNTVDVDLMVARDDFEKVKIALNAAGFIHRHAAGIDLFLDGPEGRPREGVHVLFAGEKVRKEYLVPAPTLSDIEQHNTFRVLALQPLVTMKLTSFRDKDRTHLRDFIEVGLLDASWIERLPAELGARLKLLLDTPEG
jgi:hypothetical protein